MKTAYLDHAAVTVADIEWTRTFFIEILGMKEKRRRENNGVLEQVWLDGGIQLVSSPNDPAAGRGHHLGIMIDEYPVTLQKILSYDGVHSIPGKPEKWVQLPDGLVLELFEMPQD